MSARLFWKQQFPLLLVHLLSMAALACFLALNGNNRDSILLILLTWSGVAGGWMVRSYLLRKHQLDALLSLKEYNRFSKGIFGWIGFKTYWLSYDNIERVAGETKWNFWKLTKYAIDGIINFSHVPLSIASWFGTTMTFFSFLALAVIIIRRLIFGDPVAGWASIICVVIFIGGIQLLCLGIMGQYISKTYLETKHRPHFIIAETNDESIIRLK